ncbi:hypothetical protein V492_05986 [Pseudogymnoascus sp. VKM F-4246]|nr:hypothetical protein V492_05986 [Pseudogymnoascus sp. VKM F-4246]
MRSFNLSTRQIIALFSFAAFLAIVVNSLILFGADAPRKVLHIVLPGQAKPEPELPKLKDWSNVNGDYDANLVDDHHPIHKQILKRDAIWDQYQEQGKAISQNFSSIVLNYRERYGRSPPPGFDKWYKFARDRKVEILGDFGMTGKAAFVGPFEQIMDDLRPFWGVDPKVIRSLAGRVHSNMDYGVVRVHIRDGAVVGVNQGSTNWPRKDSFVEMIQSFVKELPDMDISVNRNSKPRVTVPWDALQKLLKIEEESRGKEHMKNEFSKHLPGLWGDTSPKERVVDPEWELGSYNPYMSIAKEACPPESLARNEDLLKINSLRRSNNTIIQNHNRSLDLCSMGPFVSDIHSMLFSSEDVKNTGRLVPIFSEAKTNVNNDILYPSALYWDASKDGEYAYDEKYDSAWEDKNDTMFWRGISLVFNKKFSDMQRQRLVDKLGGKFMSNKSVTVIGTDPLQPNIYGQDGLLDFQPAKYALEHTDARFVYGDNCRDVCTDLEKTWELQNATSFSKQLRNKYVLDVDGDGFSPRFRSLLQSRSLPIKSTLFKEWHSSRLFAWVHFVPLGIEYRELYSLLTYFVGYGNSEGNEAGEDWVNKDVYVQRHDFEGRLIAKRGSEWAKKVLRREDMEVYMYRLLLEYGRIIDDDRDILGYPGDGSEVHESKWKKLIGLGG